MAVTTEDVTADVKRRCAELLESVDFRAAGPEAWFGARFDAGLAWVNFPVGEGGLGLSPSMQRVVESELAAARAPAPSFNRNPIGLGMAAATIVAHGTPEQKQRYLRTLYVSDVWCQLFSEPGAGSDLAALATRAVRDGDEWVVNGQKVWTTLAHRSKFGLLVARTDPALPKHKGLTYFVVDMSAPGVEIRPLRQMTGEAEFNEVYFTDARVPDSMRLGEVGEGWRVSMTTLMNERVAIGSGTPPPRGSGTISLAVRTYKECRPGPVERDHLMKLWVQAEAIRLTNLRAAAGRAKGTPGPEGSVGKLAFAILNQKITEYCVNVMGATGQIYESGYEMTRPDEAALFQGDVTRFFLRARANSIEGGTSEVMRNILAERVLGLPGDVRVDKDLPWKDVPR